MKAASLTSRLATQEPDPGGELHAACHHRVTEAEEESSHGG